MSSTPSRCPVGIGRATAGILVSLQCLLDRHLLSDEREEEDRHCHLVNPDHCACHSTVGISNDANDLLWLAIVSQQFPEALLNQTDKCLLIINEADIERKVPFT